MTFADAFNARTIVCATDFSPTSRAALMHAVTWAQQLDATLHVVSVRVTEKDARTMEAPEVSAGDRVREYLRDLIEREVPMYAPYDPKSIRMKHATLYGEAAAPALVRYARDHNADLMVMGTHGRRGVRKAMLGSVCRETLHHASCPVLVVRGDIPEPSAEAMSIRRILAPIEDPAAAGPALHLADALAGAYDAELCGLHVIESYVYAPFYVSSYDMEVDSGSTVGACVTAMQEVYADVGGRAPRAEFHAILGHAKTDLPLYAEEDGADLIVMGTTGRTRAEYVLLGSVTEATLVQSPVPVLVLPAAMHDTATSADAAAEALR